MSKAFIPEIAAPHRVTSLVTKTVAGFMNIPPQGTRMRATLGETVVVGEVHSQNFYQGGPTFEAIYIMPDSVDHVSPFDLWFSDGWTFEILDDEVKS